VATSVLVIVSRRYRHFTGRDHVMIFRNGQLHRKQIGGGYFLLPLIDELVVLPVVDQLMEFSVRQQIVFKPEFTVEEPNIKIDMVKISGFLVYKIEDFERFYANGCTVFGVSVSGDDLMISTSKVMKDIVEGHLMRQVLEQPIDQLYTNRSQLMSQLYDSLDEYRQRNGLIFLEGDITHFDL